jgi:hypothetical protein
VVGKENITDGNHTRYQEIAEHIAAAAVERGSDGFEFIILYIKVHFPLKIILLQIRLPRAGGISLAWTRTGMVVALG